MSTLKTTVFAVVLLLAVGNSYAAHKHDNDVYFAWTGGGSASLSYSEQGHVINPKQPWEGVSSSQNGNTLHIRVVAGRKEDPDVASRFNGTLYDGAIAWWEGVDVAGVDAGPHKLNFYTYGVLRINGDAYEVSIGQGSIPGHNNWWVGGQNLTGFRARSMLATTDGKYTIAIGSDDHHFNIYPNRVVPNWMQAHIADTMTLAQYSIPGTHDSGTYAMNKGSVTNTEGVTQDYSILAQLNMGIRVLDIRLDSPDSSGTLWIYHNFVPTDLSFSSALKQALDFLQANPGETVVMFIKHEHGSTDITGAFYAALKDHDASLNRYWLADSMPQTGQVRGKIVFVNRDGDIGPYGINVVWQKNCTFTSPPKDVPGIVDFRIQDQFKYSGSANKIQAFDSLLNEISAAPYKYWYVNYLSAEEVPVHGPKYIAGQVNPKALNELETTYRFQPVGTIMMDYAGEIRTPEIIAAMLHWNQLSASAPRVAFLSVHSEIGSRRALDTFVVTFDLLFAGDTGIDPTQMLNSTSYLALKFGEYAFAGTFGDNARARYTAGRPGQVTLVGPEQDYATITWNARSVAIRVWSNQSGTNIVRLTQQNGPVSGHIDFVLDLDWLSWRGTVAYAGRATSWKNPRTGETLQAWTVRSQ